MALPPTPGDPLAPGFAEPVLDSQRTFRAVLDAVPMPAAHEMPARRLPDAHRGRSGHDSRIGAPPDAIRAEKPACHGRSCPSFASRPIAKRVMARLSREGKGSHIPATFSADRIP